MGFRLGRHRRVKRGDRVYVYWAGRGYDAEVVGFRSCSFVVRFLDNGNQVELPPYNHGLFYGFCYEAGTAFFYMSHPSHLRWVLLCEKLRLKLPYKICRFLRLMD